MPLPSATSDKSIVRLRFKSEGLPLHLEYILVNRYGFTFFSRKSGEWVIYERYRDPPPKSGGLSEMVIADLTRKCNAIAYAFANPDEHKDIIRVRTCEFARSLEPKKERWVMDWIKRVIDEEEPPWTEDT